MQLEDLKAVYRIPTAWRDLGLPGQPGKSVASPFREDHSPSFSVFQDGMRYKDHATGDGGDLFDFVMMGRMCAMAEAVRFVEERLGITCPEHQSDTTWKPAAKLPPLRAESTTELRELANGRGFAVEGLQLAQERGFLKFATLWRHPAWCVSDRRQQLHEFRRIDGQLWPAYGRLSERKSHCTGTGKSWPLGVEESRSYPKIAMVEGAPDFLAAFHFMVVERKQDTVAPVAVLGAANHRLAPEAMAMFAGKTVCLYPHVDEAGVKAAKAWALALRDAGAARVTAFDLSGLILVDDTKGKDLADVCRVNADCFEQQPKLMEILP
jgi:hypothetical protein